MESFCLIYTNNPEYPTEVDRESGKRPLVAVELQRSIAKLGESVSNAAISGRDLFLFSINALARRKPLLKVSHDKYCLQKKVHWSTIQCAF